MSRAGSNPNSSGQVFRRPRNGPSSPWARRLSRQSRQSRSYPFSRSRCRPAKPGAGPRSTGLSTYYVYGLSGIRHLTWSGKRCRCHVTASSRSSHRRRNRAYGRSLANPKRQTSRQSVPMSPRSKGGVTRRLAHGFGSHGLTPGRNGGYRVYCRSRASQTRTGSRKSVSYHIGDAKTESQTCHVGHAWRCGSARSTGRSSRSCRRRTNLIPMWAGRSSHAHMSGSRRLVRSPRRRRWRRSSTASRRPSRHFMTRPRYGHNRFNVAGNGHRLSKNGVDPNARSWQWA